MELVNVGCDIQTVRWFRGKVNEIGTYEQVFASCKSHDTSSPHDFRSTSEAYRYFRCDSDHRQFLILDLSGDFQPHMCDLTGLTVHIAHSYEDAYYGNVYGDFRYYEIRVIEGNPEFQPVNVQSDGSRDFDSDCYSYPVIKAYDHNGDLITWVTLRIDGRS